jgi:hypothetical protein
LEIFNELCVLVASVELIVFTAIVQDREVKVYGGYLLITTILLNFGANVLIQLRQSLSHFKLVIIKACNYIKRKLTRNAKVQHVERPPIEQVESK